MKYHWNQTPFTPQPSERWVMYWLVAPIIDEACEINGLRPYFEYSRPNGPNRRLSVDIALIDHNGRAVWMIEAKNFARPINPGFIFPYLTQKEMGVVSNGNMWVFSIGDETTTAGPILDHKGHVIRKEVDRVIAALSQTEPSAVKAVLEGWGKEWSGYMPVVAQKVWHLEKGTGERYFAEKTQSNSLCEAVDTILATSKTIKLHSPLGRFLLMLQDSEAEISAGRIEFSENRLTWWLPNKRRAARIDLTMRQLEILVLNAILDPEVQRKIIAPQKMHDKNPSMTIYKASTDAELKSLVPVFTSHSGFSTE